jgi:hypothetical protein
MATDHLWKRGNVWNLRLAIPRKLQHHFLSSKGKPLAMIVEPLGDSPSAAKIAAAQRVAYYLDIFRRLERGESLEDIRKAEAEAEAVRQETADFIAQQRAAGVPDSRTQKFLALTDVLHALGLAPAPASGLLASSTSTAPVAPRGTATPASISETVSEAAAAMYQAMKRDGLRQQTIDGHRLRVAAFVEHVGDIPLASITRRVAADWLDRIGEGRSNRTRNAYGITMAQVIESARTRGRYEEGAANPFKGQSAKVAKASYQDFTDAELAALFAALPREIRPTKHTPESALPWACLIAARYEARRDLPTHGLGCPRSRRKRRERHRPRRAQRRQ